MVGIIGALSVEIGYLLDTMQRCGEETVSGITFYKGALYGAEAVVAQSGVGKVQAAVCAQTMILRYAPRIIINTGVAGGLAETLSPGDVVVASSLVQHDIDNTGFGDPPGLIAGIDLVHIPCSEYLVRAFCDLAGNAEGYGCHSGTIATGDQFVCDPGKAAWIRENFGALACEQEGGSIAQVCRLNGVDFCVLRAISDNADSDSHSDYFEFLRLAAQRSSDLLGRFLATLNQ